jgi:hypothetical protein
MHIAALIGCLRQRLAQRRSEPGVIVGDDKLDAMQTACLKPNRKSRQLDRLSRLASSTANTWRRPSQSMPIAIRTAWLAITPASRTRS